MTMYQIGYSLVQNGQEITTFPGLPESIQLPSVEDGVPGDIIMGAVPGKLNEDGYFLLPRFRDNSAEAPYHSHLSDGNATVLADMVVVIGNYSATPDVVPQQISPLQIRLALNAVGLRASVDAYIATLPADDKDKWEYATLIERSNHTLVAGAAALNLTERQVDDLFRLAATLL